MRGRITGYAAWQARDFAYERGLPMLIVSALLLFPIIVLARTARQRLPDGVETGAMALEGFAQTIPLLAFVLVLLAVNGIVSNDRKRGFFRFLFAKPVSVLRYYAQAFLVSGIGLLAAGAVVVLAMYALALPVLPWGTLGFLALYFLGLGGLCFLLSCAFRTDWILLAGIWMLASLLRMVFPADASWYGRVFHVILPPAHVVPEISAALVHGGAPPAMAAVWLAGYGVAAFVMGMLLLARRPLAT